jgi:hypothetical protein
MLRDMAELLADLHAGIQAYAAAAQTNRSGVRITRAEMSLPVDSALLLKDGGCALLADVARNSADAAWGGTPSRLTLTWAETATAALEPQGKAP